MRTFSKGLYLFLIFALTGNLATFFSSSALASTCAEKLEFHELSSVAAHSDKLFQKMTEKFKEKFPNFSSDELKMQEINISGRELATHQFDLRFRGKVIATIWFAFSQTTLRFDIEISDYHFRNLGLYGYLLGAIVKSHPFVTEIPTRMPIGLSTNAFLFFDSVFKGKVLRLLMGEGENITKLSKEELIDLRKKLIEEFWNMPAAKVRAEMGFMKLTKLIVHLGNKKGVDFVVQNGEKLPEDQVNVILTVDEDPLNPRRRLPFEITSDGLSAVGKDVLLLGEYDRLPPGGH